MVFVASGANFGPSVSLTCVSQDVRIGLNCSATASGNGAVSCSLDPVRTEPLKEAVEKPGE